MACAVHRHTQGHLDAWNGLLFPPLLMGIVEHVHCQHTEASDGAKCPGGVISLKPQDILPLLALQMSRWRHSRSGIVGRTHRQSAGSVLGLAPTLR